MKKPKFGTAGNPQSFYDEGYKASIDMPKWLADRGLDLYEYSLTHGARLGQETAEKIGQQAYEHGICITIHSPYFINLSTLEETRQGKNKGYFYDSCQIAKWMGAKRVVFHPGNAKKLGREKSFAVAKEAFKTIIDVCEPFLKDGICLCPETMGRYSALGMIDEVMEMCKMADNIIPTVDFGHLNCLMQSRMKTPDDYIKVFKYIENHLGKEILDELHVHFTRIKYTDKGESKHVTFNDPSDFGPHFIDFARAIADYKIYPYVVCESRGTQAEDSMKYKEIYNQIMKEKNK